MKVFSLHFILTAGTILLATPLQAELVDCDGTWTNKGCETVSSSHTLSEAKQPANKNASKETLRKRILVQSIASLRRDLEKRFSLRLNTVAVESFCLEPETTLAECKEEVDSLEERLVRRTQMEEALAEKKSKEKEQKQKKAEVEPTTNIVIVQDDGFPVWHIRPRRRPHYRRPKQIHRKPHHRDPWHRRPTHGDNHKGGGPHGPSNDSTDAPAPKKPSSSVSGFKR